MKDRVREERAYKHKGREEEGKWPNNKTERKLDAEGTNKLDAEFE